MDSRVLGINSNKMAMNEYSYMMQFIININFKKIHQNTQLVNPLLHIKRHLQKTVDLINSNFKIRREHQKHSYERRVYESVDDGRLS